MLVTKKDIMNIFCPIRLWQKIDLLILVQLESTVNFFVVFVILIVDGKVLGFSIILPFSALTFSIDMCDDVMSLLLLTYLSLMLNGSRFDCVIFII